MKKTLTFVGALALVVLFAVPARSAWEYTFHKNGTPTDRLEFKVEAAPAILTGFHRRDDLPRGYVRYRAADGTRQNGILCEIPWVLNHRDVNFAGVREMNGAFAVVIGFKADGSGDYRRATAKYAGRRMAVVINHRMVAIIRTDRIDEDGLVEVEGGFPREVAEAMVRRLYAKEN